MATKSHVFILSGKLCQSPIMAGYNWILTAAPIFVGRFLKEFYSKFDTILTYSVSLIRILEKTKFSVECFLFALEFKSLYLLILVEVAISMTQKEVIYLNLFYKTVL